MAERDDWPMVGKLVGAQGLRGELKVNPASDFQSDSLKPGPRWLRSKPGSSPSRFS